MKRNPMPQLALALSAAALTPFGELAAQAPTWGLGPIGTQESRSAPQLSWLAPGHQNVNYDGRFTYARIAFNAQGNGGGFFGGGGRGGGGDPKWDHDYPNADRNFPTILSAVSNLLARSDGSVILRSDDPDLFKFPFAYLCEVGYWNPSEVEVLGLRKYLLKGGFVIVDDFQGAQTLANFKQQIQRVIPKAEPILLPDSHPIFDSFYRIKDFSVFVNTGGGRGGRGGGGGGGGNQRAFYGIFENNDPTQRMLMIVNHNFDVSEFWEYSATGRYAVSETNEAYKLGVNYVMYSLTR